MKRVKYLRQERGLSQRALGERARVDASYICNAESRGLKLYPSQEERIAEALGWEGDPAELFEESEVR